MNREGQMNDHTLRLYLLGELAETEAEGLERELLADDELFDLAEAVEADLLDAAARGDLTPAERERVARRLAASPAGRFRLALARDLATLAREEAVVLPFRPRVETASPAWRTASPAWRAAAAAACAALVVVSGWVAWSSGRGPVHVLSRPEEPEIVQIPVPPAAPTSPAAPPEEPAATPPPVLVRQVISLAVATLRGAGTEVERLVVSPGVQLVELQLDVTDEEAYTSFRITVSDRDREIAGDQVTAVRDGASRTASLTIPAEHLRPGLYTVDLEGLNAGTKELLGRLEVEFVR